jgi:hypothetical protein
MRNFYRVKEGEHGPGVFYQEPIGLVGFINAGENKV